MPGSGILSEELLPWYSWGLWRSVHGRPLKLGWPFTTVQWKQNENHGLNHCESLAGRILRTCPDILSQCDWWLSVSENTTSCYVTMYAPTNSRTSDHAECPASSWSKLVIHRSFSWVPMIQHEHFLPLFVADDASVRSCTGVLQVVVDVYRRNLLGSCVADTCIVDP